MAQAQLLRNLGNYNTVTPILGLGAFTARLLCEQVVGRGLRCTHYDVSPETGLFEPEKDSGPTTVILEVKGFESEQDRQKEAAAHRWVRAVDHHGGIRPLAIPGMQRSP